jgi:hypothetical protein
MNLEKPGNPNKKRKSFAIKSKKRFGLNKSERSSLIPSVGATAVFSASRKEMREWNGEQGKTQSNSEIGDPAMA